MTLPQTQLPSATRHPAPHELQRRQLLQLGASLAAAGSGGSAMASASSAGRPDQGGSPKPPSPTGRPGDFDFLRGEWRIQNRQLDKHGVWQQFEGEATVYAILAGIGSVEELRIHSRQFSGMGLRLLDVERKLWADHWVNAKSGVLTPPPAWGSFVRRRGHLGQPGAGRRHPHHRPRHLGPDHAAELPLDTDPLARWRAQLAGQLGHALATPLNTSPHRRTPAVS